MTALIKSTPRLEPDQIQTAVEIAEEKFSAANKMHEQAERIARIFEGRLRDYSDELADANKQYNKTAGTFKRSKRRDTKARLYREMIYWQEEIQRLSAIVEGLREYHNKADNLRLKALGEYRDAKWNLITARVKAGLIYTVRVVEAGFVNRNADNQREFATATVAEAVSVIYRHNVVYWSISKDCAGAHFPYSQSNVIASGSKLDVFAAALFNELIDEYDEKITIIDAEIVDKPKIAVTYATPADEFAAIAFRAIHHFTLDDFVTPIAELRAFCRDNPNFTAAQIELSEWLALAQSAGVDVSNADAVARLEDFHRNFRYRNGFKFTVEKTIAALDDIFTALISQKSVALIQELAAAKNALECDIVRMEANLRRLMPADMSTIAKANIYADLLDCAKGVLDFLNNNPVAVELHEQVIAQWKVQPLAYEIGTVALVAGSLQRGKFP